MKTLFVVFEMMNGALRSDTIEIEGKWEARADGVQVRSKFGRTSWSVKAYAKEVAREFCSGMK